MGNLRYCDKHRRAWLKTEPGCINCIEEQKILDEIENVTARFYAYKVSEQVELDFAWLIKTLKEKVNGSH